MKTPRKGASRRPPTRHPHLGKLITQVLLDAGMSKAEFGRRICTSRQNVALILNKSTLDSHLIWRVSEVFGIDLFQRISSELQVARPQTNTAMVIKLEFADQTLEVVTVLDPKTENKRALFRLPDASDGAAEP